MWMASHPDLPGLRASTGHADSGLQEDTCVLNTSGSVRAISEPSLPCQKEEGLLMGILSLHRGDAAQAVGTQSHLRRT